MNWTEKTKRDIARYILDGDPLPNEVRKWLIEERFVNEIPHDVLKDRKETIEDWLTMQLPEDEEACFAFFGLSLEEVERLFKAS